MNNPPAAKLPPELWAVVIANHDAHDRRTLLPLQLVSKQLHSLVTPVIYTTISITLSGSQDFVEWAAARGGEQLRDVTTLVWEAQTSQTTFAHTAIPFHRISKLHSTFASNPLLASYTTSLTLRPFYEQVGSVDGWKEVVEMGWCELLGIFPFFTNVHRVAVLSSLIVPSEVLHNLPSPGQLTYLRVLATKNWNDVIPLFELHPNLQLVGLPLLRGGPLPDSNELPDMCIDLPRLKVLETGPNFWPFLSHCLSTSSFRSLRHFSILTIPTPIPPVPTLNHLLSLKIMSADTSLVRQLFQHLTLVEYISALTTMSSKDGIKTDFLFNIPSAALKYIHLEYYLPDSDFDMSSPSELFDRFPKLTIVDMDNLGDDSDSCVSRFLRSQPNSVDAVLGNLQPFQSWWESAQEELECVAENQKTQSTIDGMRPQKKNGRTIPKSQAAPSPFDREDADITLQSSDGICFQVHGIIMRLVSPFFDGMLMLPQPTPEAESDDDESSTPIIPFDEDSSILTPLLRCCYPGQSVEVNDLTILRKVLDAATKYQLDTAVQCLEHSYMKIGADVIKKTPVQTYILACRHKWSSVAQASVNASLAYSHQTLLTQAEHVDLTNYGNEYNKLLRYHWDCRAEAKTFLSSHFTNTHISKCARNAKEHMERMGPLAIVEEYESATANAVKNHFGSDAGELANPGKRFRAHIEAYIARSETTYI